MPPMWIVLALLPILGGAERFNCRSRILGAYYADAKSGCKAFHVCVRVAGGGIRDFRFFCPPGTLFHQEAQTCTDWGDDDPLACPAEIYDGQFDLYKIGSGFDTKKLSAPANRDEEAEFGLQRAETGDRRLSQSQSNPSAGASDLRAAHSSDFFSGQRERGRDDSGSAQQLPSAPSRQSFRRTSTSRASSFSQTQPTTQRSTPISTVQPSSPAQFDPPKRKLIRKRPVYVSTQAPSTFAQNTQPAQPYSEPPQQQHQQQRTQQQQFQRQSQQKTYQKKQYQEQLQKQYEQRPQQQEQEPQQQTLQQQQPYQKQPLQQQYQQQTKHQQQPKTQQQYQHQTSQSQTNQDQFQQQPQPQQHQYQHQPQQQQYQQQPQPQQYQQQASQQQTPKQQAPQQQAPQHQAPQQQALQQQAPQQQAPQQQALPQQQNTQLQRNTNFENFNRRPISQNRQTTPPPAVPVQYKEYKDEYVEVSRVTPKQSRFFVSTTSPAQFSQTTPAPFSKNNGLVELYNYNSQSTPGLNIHSDDRPIKVKNSFSVSDFPKEADFARTKGINFKTTIGRSNPTTLDYNTGATRTTPSDTASINYNSVSYEPEKNNFVSISKQNYFNNPSTTPVTTPFYTSTRPDPPLNLNTVAYNTNIGFNVPANFGHESDDDGQYRPPEGEDDGQYKPELYDRELLSGAHSLNIAASGNRLPEDQKSRAKTQSHVKSSQTAVPRPFKPAPTSTSQSVQTARPSTQTTRLSTQTIRPPTQTTRVSEATYSTTVRPQTTNTQRTFDHYQPYTTTSRPSEASAPVHISLNIAPTINGQARPTTSSVHRSYEPRPPPPPTVAPPQSSTRPPYFANPASLKEDSSYDYAYYDSDPGFIEYDHIEEFGRTNRKA